jgi:gamma-glutamyltranspeptidase/glutathione hydrolase
MKKTNRQILLLTPFFIVFLGLQSRAQDVTSKNGMVASAHPLASEAGVQILQAGGNAVDAAVATAFALAAVEPNASGLGGGGYVVYHLIDQDPYFLDYRECAPIAVNPLDYYNDNITFKNKTTYGGSSVGVPGMVAGLLYLHEQHGKLPLSQVLEPAIRYSESGFKISPHLADIILQKFDIISANTEAAQIYLYDLLPPPAGYILKNPDLAVSIKSLVNTGIKAFYGGYIAEAIVKSVQENDGYLTLKDLKSYTPQQRSPVLGTYRNYQVISAAPSSGGGTHLIELLNILEEFDIYNMTHNSALYIHLLAEALKMVLKDKKAYMADPDFEFVPVNHLISKDYAQILRNKIDIKNAQFDYTPSLLDSTESENTTHLSVVDSERNCVALTQSINLWFSCGIVAEGTGILLNNHMADFDSDATSANALEPGKRPVSSIAPTIVLKDGKPLLVVGTPGGARIIAALAQIIINIVDFDMSIDKAIEAPRIHSIGKNLYLENRIPESVRQELTLMGHRIQLKDAFDSYFGGAQAIYIDWQKKELRGGADSRRDGVAVGY